MRKLICFLIVISLAISSVYAFGNKESGKLVCGVTEFEPMNFRDSRGAWTGFDTELAQLVGQKIGMKVEFQEIEWANKYQELEAGTINAIWNGFTANASENGIARGSMVDFSYSYLRNQQCIVIKSARANEFRTITNLNGKNASAESGSAGESFAKEVIGNGRIIGAPAQINTFLEVKSGAVDFAVIDILLAQRLAGTGDYSDLMIAGINLDFEVYAVGFKKGSELTAKVNKALKELYDEGKMLALAKKYHLEESLVLDTNFRG
ncbi:MAG: transporter substrate-binding domain-containing protein [Treponema sp.]|nr:transporter substrate-binding domain-containing protein [Treponema sp.]MCL2273010.1 transporter substrate-binding domain-containing protein [Treponema sp.]